MGGLPHGKPATFALDTETTSLDPQCAALVGISLATAPGEAAYIPLRHTALGSPTQLDQEQVLERLQPLLTDSKLAKIGHHFKYDLAVLRRHGAAVGGPMHDSMLESYVYNSTASPTQSGQSVPNVSERGNHSLQRGHGNGEEADRFR